MDLTTDSLGSIDELLDTFGQNIIYRRNVIGVGPRPTETPTETNIRGIVTNFRFRDIDGTRIRATDRRIFIKATSIAFEPTTSHKVLVNSVQYSIVDARPYALQGVILAYGLQVRR